MRELTSPSLLLQKKWCQGHLEAVRDKAGPRYTPELNVSLPIAKQFESLTRSKDFYKDIREDAGKFRRHIESFFRHLERAKISEDFSNFKDCFKKLQEFLDAIREYDENVIPWPEISGFVQNMLDGSLDVTKRLEALKGKEKEVNEQIDYSVHSVREAQNILFSLKSYSHSIDAKLSNTPHMLLLGEAGIGKTHLLCDVTEKRLNMKQGVKPTVLVFGEEIDSNLDFSKQVVSRLKLGRKVRAEKFWEFLDDAGRVSNCRTLFILDAANELLRLKSGKALVSSLVGKVKKYKHIALVVSIRSGYEDLFLNESIKKQFNIVHHSGFKHREWEAIRRFFTAFKLSLPEIPVLAPEFQSPLFLLLFCKAFEGRVGKKKMIYRGQEGAIYIFENFVKSVADKLATKYKLPKGKTGSQYVIWDTVVEKLAEKMVEKNIDRIKEWQFKRIVKSAYPAVAQDKFIRDLESNMLVVKVPHYNYKDSKFKGFDYRFPFQKFSDHLIARYIFKLYYASRIGMKRFFSRRTRLGKYLNKSYNRGLVGALMIEAPERSKGLEFVELAPYVEKHYYFTEAFIESLIWRRPDCFFIKDNIPINTEKVLRRILKTEADYSLFFNAVITVSGCVGHPYNAEFLYKWLMKFTMAKRDSFWSTFLHKEARRESSVDRILEWAWSKEELKHVNDESRFLLSITLSWFLTTSNRSVRDKATKGLVCLLTHHLDLMLKLLIKFDGVNDPYILERLYAVAYGCSLRNYTDNVGLKNLAEWIYNRLFFSGEPIPHILLRDYGRGVVELALKRGVGLSIDEKNIYPPYKSQWIDKLPSEKELESIFYPHKDDKEPGSQGMRRIWFSVIGGGDFDRYVIGTNSNSCSWKGLKLGETGVDRVKIFEEFISGLTLEQSELWAAADPIIYEERSKDKSRDLSDVINIMLVRGRKDAKDTQEALEKFKHSLGDKKSYFEAEIAPFLDHSLNLSRNPYESFDLSIAQRWIVKRVYELGWNRKIHGEFDEEVDYTENKARESRKTERIGKKYQWIAFHEFFARVADNHQFKNLSWGDTETPQVYKGPWNPFERDIDPSFTLKPDFEPDHLMINKLEDRILKYNAWEEKIGYKEWVNKIENMPNPKSFISFKDDKGKGWLMLNGFVRWEQDTPPEEDKFELPRREIWYMIKSYLIPAADLKKTMEWAGKSHFMGRWMPEAHNFYEAFMGEYPNSLAYEEIRPNIDQWSKNDEYRKELPASMMLTEDIYLNEVTLDCSFHPGCSIRMPGKFLVNQMGLIQVKTDGQFYDGKGECVACPIAVWKKKKIDGGIISKSHLCKFLKDNDYAIFWTFLSEKNILQPHGKSEGSFRSEFSGAYTLNGRDELIGKFKQFVRKDGTEQGD